MITNSERKQVLGLIAQAGLEKYADALIGLVKSSIAFDTQPVTDEAQILVGRSKVGGLPDLPPEFAWPVVDGFILDFVAQINLAAVKPFDADDALPPSGILYFFYDRGRSLDDYKNSSRYNRTLYFDGNLSVLNRRALPPNRHTYSKLYTTCSLKFRNELMLPYYESYETEDLLKWSSKTRNYQERENVDAYLELQSALDASYPHESDKLSRILGYGDGIQSDVRFEAEAIRQSGSLSAWDGAGHEAEVLEQQLLFQIDSDRNANMMWGDVGRLYFCLPKAALAARRFSDTVCVMECY